MSWSHYALIKLSRVRLRLRDSMRGCSALRVVLLGRLQLGLPCIGLFLLAGGACAAERHDFVRVSADRTCFVKGAQDDRFVVWGVNYDHDRDGRLLDEYWLDEWQTVVEDFGEIKKLGANCVRVHLQFGTFMDSPSEANRVALRQLRKLVQLAEELGLLLDVTGLACYHKANIPTWYDVLDEPARWEAQACFWREVAKVGAGSPAVFCYNLMNEPVLPGAEASTDWLLGELGGKFFVQRIALDLGGRSREQVATAWVQQLADAIREHDKEHLLTVGVIPWVHVFGGGKPLFHDPLVAEPLDFVAVHFYPKAGEVSQAIDALGAYDLGKPLVIEEMFPLKCTQDELVQFIQQSTKNADGWMSFYWGQTSEELRDISPPTIADSITAAWLERYSELMRGAE